MHLLQSLTFRLVICIIFVLVFGNKLNYTVISCLYTISCVLKEILMMALPIIIFSYILSAILAFQKNAPILIASILGLVIISNAISSFVAYGVANAILPFVTTVASSSHIAHDSHIISYFSLGNHQVVSPNEAAFTGIILGIIFDYFKVPKMLAISAGLQKMVNIFLDKFFTPLLPIYILGFILKTHREGNFIILFKNYTQVFVFIIILTICYITLMYLIANKFSWINFKQCLRRMINPCITGLSTSSSAVTMPLTIAATERNISDKQFARLVIPSTVNIHMIGASLSVPVTSLAIIMLTGHPIPSLASFSLFVLYFCIAKFSAAAVPNGGIIVILPLLQSQLGFTVEMSNIILMLDILQDPFLTSANVMGNGAFAMNCHNFCKYFGFIKKE